MGADQFLKAHVIESGLITLEVKNESIAFEVLGANVLTTAKPKPEFIKKISVQGPFGNRIGLVLGRVLTENEYFPFYLSVKWRDSGEPYIDLKGTFSPPERMSCRITPYGHVEVRVGEELYTTNINAFGSPGEEVYVVSNADILCSLLTKEITPEEAKKIANEYMADMRELARLNEAVQELERQLVQRNQTIKEFMELETQHRKELKRRYGEKENLENQLAEKEQQIVQQDMKISKQNAQIESLQGELEEKEIRIKTWVKTVRILKEVLEIPMWQIIKIHKDKSSALKECTQLLSEE